MNERAPDIRQPAPKIPDPSTIDWQRARIGYDRPSDEPLVSFDEGGRPAASIALEIGDRDFVSARVDPASGESVGIQIDGFLAYGLTRYPGLVAFLARAGLRGDDDLAAADLRHWAREQRRELTDEEAMIAAMTPLIA